MQRCRQSVWLEDRGTRRTLRTAHPITCSLSDAASNTSAECCRQKLTKHAPRSHDWILLSRCGPTNSDLTPLSSTASANSQQLHTKPHLRRGNVVRNSRLGFKRKNPAAY